MLSETEIQERIEDAKFWQAKEQDGSVLDGILKAKIDELEQVIG